MKYHLDEEADIMTMNRKSDFKRLMENRRDMYQFFARFYAKEIDEEFLEQLKHIEFPTDREENGLTEFQDALLRLNEYFEYDAGETLEELAADYAHTFLGAGSAQDDAAFPYESVYTSPKHIMMQDAWNQVSEIYEAKGIERNDDAGDWLEDHISMELEFMAYLCDETSQYTETLSGLEEQKAFLNRHLLNWVPELCLKIKDYADTEFYRMVGQLTTGFLQLDSFILDRMIVDRKAGVMYSRSCTVSRGFMDEVLQKLTKDYRIYAPVHLPERGMRENDGLIRYQEISKLEDIINDRQSDFSPKEVVYPVAQTIFSFDENSARETISRDPKGIIIFARACDINGLKRLDNMFMANGGTSDRYYSELRNKVKLFLMECEQSWDNCFCVSMKTNKTDNYSIAFRLYEDNIKLKIKDAEFAEYFDWAGTCDYEPEFITENKLKVRIPEIPNVQVLKEISNHEMWEEVSEDCISCGGCNTVCGTCSCFETLDYLNQENSRKGERRRIWSSCMIPDFSKTAGGNISRKYPKQMMRYKAMHKIYDYNKRFGGNEHMCVGCGRCVQRCPEDISFPDIINRMSDELDYMAGRKERPAVQDLKGEGAAPAAGTSAQPGADEKTAAAKGEAVTAAKDTAKKETASEKKAAKSAAAKSKE